MSNSHEQSLDENVVFLPVNESSPEFLHCEKERQAVERLLNAGPEAFYSSIGTERSGCFLSSEEVSQISSWAQDYRLHPLQVQRQENGEDGSSEMEDFCSTYFPSFTDTPPPGLELGWPERSPWGAKDSVRVHTSPPAEGDPSVRQIIRWHLQNAGEVIAIVTDRLTDSAIIGDLHKAASRGVPVYIILNQRSIQETFTLNRLRHPNMQGVSKHKLPTFKVDHIIHKAISRQLSAEKSTNLDDRTRTRLDDKGIEPTHHINILPFLERRETLKREAILGKVGSINKTSSPMENKPSSRKPLILMVPQSESHKSLSDIMKRTHPQQSPSGQIRKGSKAAASELTQTMMELSVNKTQNRGVPVPRFMASCFDPDQMTPALNLMRKRNDELKPLLYRSQQNLLPRERPRSSSYASWRWSLAEAEGKQE
ncbi:hypothetical protein KUCAC02_030574 [Chaenocephalus aceratus]|uniref:Uncharacterized protein n=1 Tax=Chaenocephalus aceratus TaxID=36190 RepID=A0ACB9XKY6_CHAAC|nr:hypothetical protein KUCAC02_030574 [Chaenocephalus aceratus]